MFPKKKVVHYHITEAFSRELKMELIKHDMTQLMLSQKLNHPVSTLSSWLRNVAPMPKNLPERIEDTLGITRGSLSSLLEKIK